MASVRTVVKLAEDSAFMTWISILTGREDVTLATFRDDKSDHIFLALCDAVWSDMPHETSDRTSKQVDQRLLFLRANNIKTDGIKAKEILRGSKKVLPLIKNMFMYHLQMKLWQQGFKTDKNPCDGLLRYLNKIMEPDIEVTGFTSEWYLGSALWVLIHHINPRLCADWRNLRAADKLSNARQALHKAKYDLKIPQVFSAEDLVSGRLDQWHLIVYLSFFIGLETDINDRPLPERPDEQESSSVYEDVKDLTINDVGCGEYLTPMDLRGVDESDNTGHVYGNVSADIPIIHLPDVIASGHVYNILEEYTPPPIPHKSSQTASDNSESHRSRNTKSDNISDRQRHGMIMDQNQRASVSDSPKEPKHNILQGKSSFGNDCNSEVSILDSGPPDKTRFRKVNNEDEFWERLGAEGMERKKRLQRCIKYYNDMKIAHEPIGSSRFGGIQIARFLGEDSVFKMAATKCLPEECMVKDVIDFLNDAELMASFSHKNLMPMTAMTFDKGMPVILMPLITEGDLKDYLQKSHLSRDDLFQIVSDIAHGMEYLSSFRYVHRNLCTRSCLVTKDDTDGTKVMVGDFGFTRDTLIDIVHFMTSELQPIQLRITPPEVFTAKMPSFGETTDVWSFGVVMWEIYSKGQDFMAETRDMVSVFKKVKRGDIARPRDAPDDIWNLMNQCLNPAPVERPRFRDIVKVLGSMRLSQNMKHMLIQSNC